jgi:HesB-like selenoprotein
VIVLKLEEVIAMKFMRISDKAYDEFKSFLDSSNVQDYNLRIRYLGTNCGGPVFNIDVGQLEDDDISDKIKDINFIVARDVINVCGGFSILSSDENMGRGLELKPFIDPPSGCSGCSKYNV